LSVGAPIDANGITLGQVDSVSLDLDQEHHRFFATVLGTIYPQRLGPVFEKIRQYSGPDLARPSGRLLAAMIEQGLRAQLRTGNLLTGQLYVAVDVFPNAPPVTFQMSLPADIPTVPNNLEQLQQQLTAIADKIGKLPLDQIAADVRGTMASASRLMNRLDRQVAPDVQVMLRQATKSLADIGNLVASDGSLPASTERTVQELGRAARSLRTLADYLQTHPDSLIRGRAPDQKPGPGGLVRD
jgi:paraquat-inducible protein B